MGGLAAWQINQHCTGLTDFSYYFDELSKYKKRVFKQKLGSIMRTADWGSVCERISEYKVLRNYSGVLITKHPAGTVKFRVWRFGLRQKLDFTNHDKQRVIIDNKPRIFKPSIAFWNVFSALCPCIHGSKRSRVQLKNC